MRITKIERQRNKPRYTIYLDSGPPLDIHGETLLRFGLRRNDELDDQKLRQLQLEDLFQTAKQKSLRFLSHRPRSEKEIRDRLKKERLDEDIIDRVVENLKTNRLLNDLEFGGMYARDVMMRKPLGKMAMKHRLLQKGLARDTVETTLNTIYDEQYENTAALELARKRLPRLKRLDQIKQKQRISSYLAGRGFAWETISEVLQELYKD